MNLITHADRAELAAAVADQLIDSHRRAQTRGRSPTFALAGGDTPLPTYERFGAVALDWSNVRIFPTDERWVALDHPNRNQSLIGMALAPAQPMLAGLCPEAPQGCPDVATANASLRQTNSSFDAVVVGMGADGHFASLFPDAVDPEAALNPASSLYAVTVFPDPLPRSAPHARISLTLSRLIHTECLMLVITGREKLNVLKQAAAHDIDPRKLPVAALLEWGGDLLAVHWSP